MASIQKTLRLPDGRQVGYLRLGAPEGQPFLYFHGMPGSCYEALLLQHQASAQNLSLIAIDRPGYGLSDMCQRHSVLDWSRDVAMITDILGLERFGIIGVSGGGPFALACAHALAERITSIGIICGLGPVFNQLLLNDMSFFSRRAFSLEQAFPKLFRLLYAFPSQSLSRTAPRLAVRLLARHYGGMDGEVLLREDVQRILAENLTRAFSQGSDAATQDIHLYQQLWGFELSEITAGIQLWHGTGDRVVPASHSEFIAEQLPNAVLTLVPGAGHFSLPVNYAEGILSSLHAGKQC